MAIIHIDFLYKRSSACEKGIKLGDRIVSMNGKYFDCGNPKCGFARIRWGDCGEERLLRSLLSELCLCGKEALVKFFKATTRKDITPGIIAVIQSFGNRLNFHPHLHFLSERTGRIIYFPTCPCVSSSDNLFRERTGLIMYLPTRSASSLVSVLTLLCTLNPLCRQLNIFLTNVFLSTVYQEEEAGLCL